MMTRQRDLNQNGFTLISTMIAVGIASIVILGLGTMLTQMFQVLRGAEVASDGNDLVKEMRMNFENPEMCDQALGSGKSFSPGGGVSSLSGISLTIRGARVPFTAGASLQPGLVLKSIDLVTVTKATERQAVSLKSGSGYLYQGLVRVQLTRAVGGKSVDQAPSFIPVSFMSINGSTIANCGTTALSQSTCDSLDYVWDAGANKCIQANECSYGGSYSNTGGAPGAFTNAFTGGFNCPADAEGNRYDAIRTGSISYATKSGKYGVRSTIYPVMSCMICKDANGNKKAFNASTLEAVDNLSEGNAILLEKPTGSYTASCASCTYSASKVLKCSCRNTAGTWVTSSLNTSSCSGDIANINGGLACIGACKSKTGTGTGLANYGCMCGGNVTCSQIIIYGVINMCSESCADGSSWLQFFDISGNPTAPATRYPASP